MPSLSFQNNNTVFIYHVNCKNLLQGNKHNIHRLRPPAYREGLGLSGVAGVAQSCVGFEERPIRFLESTVGFSVK